jgi:hypothetical protein
MIEGISGGNMVAISSMNPVIFPVSEDTRRRQWL